MILMVKEKNDKCIHATSTVDVVYRPLTVCIKLSLLTEPFKN